MIHRHLWVVRFNLAEIRVQRHVERQRVLGNEFRIESGAVLEDIAEAGSRAVRWLIQKVTGRQQPIGNQLNIAARRNMLESADWRELLGKALHPLRHIGPIVVLALAQNRAIEGHAPCLLRLVRKTQALERNGEPDDVAVPRQASFGVPYRIEAEVVALTFRINCVLLNSQRVRKIVVGAMLVMEGVQEDSDAIVLVQILALGEVRAHRTGRISALEHDVQVLLVVRKISGGVLAGGIAVAGNILAEVRDSQFVFTRMAINEIG